MRGPRRSSRQRFPSVALPLRIRGPRMRQPSHGNSVKRARAGSRSVGSCGVAGGLQSRIRRARPPHPRPSRTRSPVHDICRVQTQSAAPRVAHEHDRSGDVTTEHKHNPNTRTRHTRKPESLRGRVGDEAGVPVSSSTKAPRPRHKPQPSESRRARASRSFRARCGACEGRESAAAARPKGSAAARTFAALAYASPRKANSGKMPHAHAPQRPRRQKMRWAHAAAATRRSSKYVYATGTTRRVRMVAVVIPPTRVLPKGP